ncbi:MAG: hypothetical protein ABIJ42_01610, partial [Acidobacteriota bacterium]
RHSNFGVHRFYVGLSALHIFFGLLSPRVTPDFAIASRFLVLAPPWAEMGKTICVREITL